MKATGRNIRKLREKKGYSVRELQRIFGFKDPQTIYKWQWGKSLPNVDNLVILSQIFEVPIERILILTDQGPFPFIRKK
jgi:transcriptional regulator with XRE-family HTH domain